MQTAFAPGMNFTGMATASPGWIGGVAHTAFVDVPEEGTAAATAVVAVESADPPPFTADRPFLLLNRDVPHGTILFLDRYEKP